jgi:hypothetical protein
VARACYKEEFLSMSCWISSFGGLLIMMGQHDRSEALFYYFRLPDQVPENHLLRLIDKHISFGSWFFSEQGAHRRGSRDVKGAVSFARILHVSQGKRIAPITVRLIPRLLSGELKKKAGQTATNTTPRVTAIVCANCGKSEAAQTSGNRESCGAFVTMMKATHSRPA